MGEGGGLHGNILFKLRITHSGLVAVPGTFHEAVGIILCQGFNSIKFDSIRSQRYHLLLALKEELLPRNSPGSALQTASVDTPAARR